MTILIGKTYTVTCPMPIACIGKSDAAIDVIHESDRELTVCWPVEIYAEEIQTRGGAAFAMVVSPGWLGGRFTWTNSCCSVSSYGGMFTYSCGGSCTRRLLHLHRMRRAGLLHLRELPPPCQWRRVWMRQPTRERRRR